MQIVPELAASIQLTLRSSNRAKARTRTSIRPMAPSTGNIPQIVSVLRSQGYLQLRIRFDSATGAAPPQTSHSRDRGISCVLTASTAFSPSSFFWCPYTRITERGPSGHKVCRCLLRWADACVSSACQQRSQACCARCSVHAMQHLSAHTRPARFRRRCRCLCF